MVIAAEGERFQSVDIYCRMHAEPRENKTKITPRASSHKTWNLIEDATSDFPCITHMQRRQWYLGLETLNVKFPTFGEGSERWLPYRRRVGPVRPIACFNMHDLINNPPRCRIPTYTENVCSFIHAEGFPFKNFDTRLESIYPLPLKKTLLTYITQCFCSSQQLSRPL